MNGRWWMGRGGRLAIALALMLLAIALPRLMRIGSDPDPSQVAVDRGETRALEASGDQAIAEAFRERRSGVWVESDGAVERLLPDDRTGSRHQRFVLRLENGQTLLFAHNIDLAPRAPLQPRARIRFRGQYEWNERGGTVHWTHHDPDGRTPGGWLEVDGKRYR